MRERGAEGRRDGGRKKERREREREALMEGADTSTNRGCVAVNGNAGLARRLLSKGSRWPLPSSKWLMAARAISLRARAHARMCVFQSESLRVCMPDLSCGVARSRACARGCKRTSTCWCMFARL